MGRQYKQLYKEFLSNVGKHRVGTVIPDEFALIFNVSVEEVLTNKLSVMGVNKKITDDLQSLTSSSNNVSMTLDNTELYRCFTVARPTGCRRIKSLRVVLDDKYNSRCVYLEPHRKNIVLESVFDKPTIKRCYYEEIVQSNNLYIRVFVPTITQTAKMYCDFYKEPTLVSASDVISTNECPYSNEMCTDIINVASRMCIERNQDGRYQTFVNELRQKQNNQ